MISTRKILLAVVLTLAVAVLLSVCAFAAYSDNTAFPQGVSSADTTGKYIPSGYADVDDDPDYVIGETSQAPLAKTIDLSYQTKWGDVQAECFNVKSDGYTIILYSGNCTTNINKISSATFFGGSNAANLKVKIVIADKSGNPVDPAAYITALTGQIQDTSVTDRIFIYRVETGKFVNPSGTEFQ